MRRTTGEEIVVCRTRAERVEIHCHGGDVAAAAIIASLVERGCQQIEWQQWVRASEPDAIAAAARIALARAPTARVASILCDQHAGALRAALDAIDAQIARGELTAARAGVDRLLARWELGRRLVEPWRVVLAGPPNVGKSSLINALVGYERAIVHSTPGTTRDVVSAATAFDGWPVELSDTAGLRSSVEPLETAGMGLARGAMQVADLVVLVRDASKSPSDEERRWHNPGRWHSASRISAIWSTRERRRAVSKGLPSARKRGPGSKTFAGRSSAGWFLTPHRRVRRCPSPTSNSPRWRSFARHWRRSPPRADRLACSLLWT